MDYLILVLEKYLHFRKRQCVWKGHFSPPHRSNLLRILAENKLSTLYIAYPEYQKSSTGYQNDKMADKMGNKTFKKNITKETTDPELNDLEINDNSTIDNLITITRIDCINDNLGNNDKFNVLLEVLLNYDKETQTRNNNT